MQIIPSYAYKIGVPVVVAVIGAVGALAAEVSVPVVSNDPPEVPEMVGWLDCGAAIEFLKLRGLEAHCVEGVPVGKPPGTVIAQAPRPGERPTDRKVGLTIDPGVIVPNLVGTQARAVRTYPTALKYRFERRIVTGNQIVATDPPAGRAAARDSFVTIYLGEEPLFVGFPCPPSLRTVFPDLNPRSYCSVFEYVRYQGKRARILAINHYGGREEFLIDNLDGRFERMDALSEVVVRF